jgi:hypothetical protein
VVATTVENIQHFPISTLVVPQPEEHTWTLAGQINARVVVCHSGPQAMLGMTTALAIDRPAVTIFHGCDASRWYAIACGSIAIAPSPASACTRCAPHTPPVRI